MAQGPSDRPNVQPEHPSAAHESRSPQSPRATDTFTTAQETQAPRRSTWGAPSARLDDWIALEPDGTVVAFSGKVETGTGVRTALAQIVAEELDVPIGSVRMVMGDTGRTPDEGYTAGSMTVQMGGTALRNAAAEARRALIEMAAERLEAAPDDLEARDGAIAVQGVPSRRVTYAELMGGRRFERSITGTAPLKRPEEYRLVGTSAQRLDLKDKLTGRPSFVHDLRLPGMLHARVLRSRHPGARVEALDPSRVRDAQVVRLGNFVAVVAPREEQAVRAAEQLQVTWDEPADLPPADDLFEWMRAQPTTDQVLAEAGDVAVALGQAARHVHAEYRQPYQAHASTGPSCAVAEMRDGQLTVWCSSGGVYPLRGALADLLEIPLERVHVIHLEGAGAYGQNGSEDVAADAALLARAVGRPVRVQWSRADEFIGEPKAAPMLVEIHAGLDGEGHILGWDYQAWSPTHANRPRNALGLLAGCEVRGQQAPPAQFFFGAERNAVSDYALANQQVMLRGIVRPPLRTSSMRSLGATGNTFANESFMDELAAAAGADPLEFRLRHLEDPRARDVLAAVANRAGWGEPLPAGEGRGVAFVRYGGHGAYVAMVAHVAVDAATGAIHVQRVVVAHDCGLVVNPDGVRNQIEGNVLQGVSRALKEELRCDAVGQTSLDWESYPILTFSEVPDIDIVLLDRRDQPSMGAGEPATVTVEPAIANAIYAATGARLRQVPFTPARLHDATVARR